MSEGQNVGRRTLIAGAAALAAGLLAKQSAEPVAAASTMFTDTNNQATVITGITTPGAVGFQAESTKTDGVGLVGFNSRGTTGVGTKGLSNYIGVQGGIGALGAPVAAGFTIGVQGANFATGTSNTGVQGLIDSLATSAAPNTTPSSIGVEGRNNSSGAGSIGVLGTIGPYPGFIPDTSTAVGGLNLSTGRQTFGVTGEIHGATGAGIIGAAHGPAGVGLGAIGPRSGLTGVSSAADGANAGVFAYTGIAGGIAFQASGVAGSTAGIFYGNVTIHGTLTSPVMQASVTHQADNTQRLVYATAAPEPWIEDFGEGTLAGGKADINLDPDFAALVDTNTLHVFLTAHTPQHLHVPARNATGFSVVATTTGNVGAGLPPPPAAGTFSWRVVAKRKDIAGTRLAKTAAPTKPAPPPIYELPVPDHLQKLRNAALAANKK